MTASVTADLPAVWRQTCQWTGELHQRYGWVRLTWQSHRPHEVAAEILEKDWLIGWELVRDGVHHPTGIGDIRITPIPPGIYCDIELSNLNGEGVARVARRDLAGFVTDVQRVWRDIDYTPELDAWLAEVLGGDYRRPAPPPPAGGAA